MNQSTDASALERLLRRERTIMALGLGLLAALAGLYVATGAGLGMSAWDMTSLSLFPHRAQAAAAGAPTGMAGMAGMAGMDMSGMDMVPAADPGWSAGRWALTVAMWWTMMVAMMTPSAAPAILLYGRVHRAAAASGRAGALAPAWSFAAGYLLVWLGFSAAAAVLQYALEQAGLVSAGMMGSQSKWLSVGVLAAAGLYQLSPLQRVCLDHCRGPVGFFTRHWRPGMAGAARLGALHGAYCVGCCWLLMALLFVGGVMNLAWIAAIAVLVLAEKLLPGGRGVGRAAGVLLLTWAAATAFA